MSVPDKELLRTMAASNIEGGEPFDKWLSRRNKATKPRRRVCGPQHWSRQATN